LITLLDIDGIGKTWENSNINVKNCIEKSQHLGRIVLIVIAMD